MQYEQLAGGKRVDLPRPSIDTGMGLERMTAVLQGTHDDYKTDLFGALIEAVADLTACRSGRRTQGLASRHRRPSARELVPDRRRRAAVERGPRLRAAPDHAPRHASRRTARRQRAADVEAGAGARSRNGPGLSRSCIAPRPLITETLKLEEDPLSPHARARACDPRRGGEVAQEAATCSTASPRSRSTTPTAFRSISPRTRSGRAASASISPSFTDAMERQREKARAVVGRLGRGGGRGGVVCAARKVGGTEFLGYETETAQGDRLGAGARAARR